MSADAKQTLPIQVQWHGGDIVFTPADEDRFLLGTQASIVPSQGKLAVGQFVDQFKTDLLPRVRQWCEQHAEKLLACYIPFGFEQLTVFAVTRLPRYDFSLSDSIADFEMDLFEAHWPVEVRQIPSGSPETLDSFFNSAESIQVYGHTE